MISLSGGLRFRIDHDSIVMSKKVFFFTANVHLTAFSLAAGPVNCILRPEKAFVPKVLTPLKSSE